MSVKITYYVHGTTTDNLEHKSTGWLPGELSEKGIAQSKELKENISKEKFDIVFTSDLKRAIDSAKINFEDTTLEIKQDMRIRECNYGDLNGADESMVKYAEHIKDPFPNGESLEDVERRISEFLNFLLENYDNKNVAIVAHKAPQLAIEKIVYNKTWEKALEDDWRKTKAWKPGWKYEFGQKESVWTKGLKFAQNTSKTLWEETKLAGNKVKEFTNDIIGDIKINKAFKDQTDEFEILGTKKTIRAFREIDKSELFFRQDDKELKNIISDTLLKNKSDNSEIIILEVDKRTSFTKTLRIINENISNIPVICIRAIYKKHENKPSTYNVYNTQTVNVAEGATTGDIIQVVHLEKLNEIENAINSFQPSIFQKSKKDEAIKLYGNFKNCIINKQKDEKLFDKFLKVLKVILPSMVQVATALIACI